jgi:hypothetical protein
MLTPIDIQQTKQDLYLYSTVLIISNLVGSYLDKTSFFNKSWLNLTIATLMGVILHGLLTNKLTYIINNSFKIKNISIKKIINNFIKLSTIFISQKIITSYIAGISIIFDQEWLLTCGLTIGSYSIFNICESFIPKISNYQPLFNDIILVSTSALVVNYFYYWNINKNHIIRLVSILYGLVIFHFIIKQSAVSKNKIKKLDKKSTIPKYT